MTVVPIYRDFTSAKSARAAWNEGTDFRIADAFSRDDGRHINNADAQSAGIEGSIVIRFADLRKTCRAV